MTQTPDAPAWDGQPLAPDGPAPLAGLDPYALAAELGPLTPVLIESLHQGVHFLGQIAAELARIRQAVNRQEEIFGAYQRGGRLAAGVAARQMRKNGGKQS